MEPKKQPKAGKISVDRLAHLEKFTYDGSNLSKRNALYSFTEDNGQRIEFLWRPKRHQKRLFVLFSGDARRPKLNPPVFQRWTWAKFFPGSCIYFSDPSLHLSESLGLAWYSGTSQYDPLQRMAEIALKVADQLGVQPEDICSYGSSGGGFASLRFASIVPEAACITINPQIVIPRFLEKKVNTYLETCFGGISKEAALQIYPDRFDLRSISGIFQRKRIVYVQNVLDTHHYDDHFVPFCETLGVNPGQDDPESAFRQVLFSDSAGHAKAESMKEFDTAISILSGRG